MNFTALTAKDLSDSELDKYFAASFDAKKSDVYTLQAEILDRLATVRSFITGVFGSVRFPLYDARGNFKQVDTAQTALKDNAAQVADKISWGVWRLAIPIMIVVIAVYIISRKIK